MQRPGARTGAPSKGVAMEHTGAVVVGLGGTRDVLPELDWAAREAQTRARPLHVLRAYDLADITLPWDTSLDTRLTAELRRADEERVRTAVVHARRLYPELLVWGDVVDGAATDVLRDASTQAEVTVLGSRRLNAFDSAILGSVSTVVAASAAGPVVVVSDAAEPSPDAAVVVGIDGSADTDAVLAFALDYASRHARTLRAVYCWSPDLLATMQWRPDPPVPERAARWLAEAVAGWQEKYPDVTVRRVVARDFPVAGLLAEAAGQDLLVVGSHSRHPRLGTLLGSVSQGVLHHARCPVAVVHSAQSGPPRGAAQSAGGGLG
jgi:nucleotide-binding universal stress UspA family protein